MGSEKIYGWGIHFVFKQLKSDQREDDSMPTIASPILGRRGKQAGVEPHLHLMCDLLPCQHSQQLSEKRFKSKELERSDHQSRQSKVCERSNSVDDEVKSESDSKKIELDTGRYRYLEAERPHVDVGTSKPPSKQSESKSSKVDNAQNYDKRNVKDFQKEKTSNLQQSSNIKQNGKESNRGKEKVPQPRECHSPSMKKFESVSSAIGQVTHVWKIYVVFPCYQSGLIPC